MRCLLTINGGSSSIRFALFREGASLERLFDGKIDRIGLKDTLLKVVHQSTGDKTEQVVPTGDQHSAARFLIDWLTTRDEFPSVRAIGHRVVHGMDHTQPERVTALLLEELRRIEQHDPAHLPVEIDLIEGFRGAVPDLPQIACFDTAFHSTMPTVARLLPIPRRYAAKGVRRYGFHGLSYAFLIEELERSAGTREAHGRLVLAHLGGGVSMAAVRDGRSIDTSMGFTPAAGLPMSTRSGDLDPGLAWYLERVDGMTAAQFAAMANQDSGLLGISETSSDMQDLLAVRATDTRAAEAIDLFCYEARKRIGSYAAALGGLDGVVFAGGIGENSSAVRAGICEGLGFLGIELDDARNAAHAPVISRPGSPVTVRVIRTDEELMIAKTLSRVLGPAETGEPEDDNRRTDARP